MFTLMNFKEKHHLSVYLLIQELGLSVFFWNMCLEVLFPPINHVSHVKNDPQ